MDSWTPLFRTRTLGVDFPAISSKCSFPNAFAPQKQIGKYFGEYIRSSSEKKNENVVKFLVN